MKNFKRAANAYLKRMRKTVFVATYRNGNTVRIISVDKKRIDVYNIVEAFRKESTDKNPAHYKISEVEMGKIHEHLDVI